MSKIVMSFLVAVALAGCGKPGNPLLDIPEGQFKNLFAKHKLIQTNEPSCLEKIHYPDRVKPQYSIMGFGGKMVLNTTLVEGSTEEQINRCLNVIQQNAASPFIGIKDNITYDHIRDPRVRDRGIALGIVEK